MIAANGVVLTASQVSFPLHVHRYTGVKPA